MSSGEAARADEARADEARAAGEEDTVAVATVPVSRGVGE